MTVVPRRRSRRRHGTGRRRPGGRRRVHRPDARRRPRGKASRAPRRASTAAPAAPSGPGDEHVREGHPARRRPVLLRPRPRRLPELRGHAGGVRRALAGRLGRDPDRPARQRVAEPTWTPRTRSSSASSRSPTTRRAPTATAQRPVLVARRRQPPGLLDRPAGRHGATRRTRPASGRVVGATWVGSNETTVDHAYAGGGYDLEVKIPMADLPAAVRPGPDRTQHHAVRQRRHRGAGHDDAAAHRHQLAPGVVGVRQRPVRPVRWGHATLPGYTPPAGRPTRRRTRRLEPEPQRCRVAADDRPVGARRRPDLGPYAGPGE